MKVGDLVKLHTSSRRNGKLAGHYGLVVDMDWACEHPVISVDDVVKSFHVTQIESVVKIINVSQ